AYVEDPAVLAQADGRAANDGLAIEGRAPVRVALERQARMHLTELDHAARRFAPPRHARLRLGELGKGADRDRSIIEASHGTRVRGSLDERHSVDTHPVVAMLGLEAAIESRDQRVRILAPNETGAFDRLRIRLGRFGLMTSGDEMQIRLAEIDADDRNGRP